MKKSFLTGILTLTAAAGVLMAAPGRVDAVKADGAIKLDGAVTEKAWDAAAWQGNFTNPVNGKKAYQETRFKVLAGKNGLYFAIDAVDNDIFTAEQEHDFALWNNDCIEIFMIPVAEPSSDRNIREHKQFVRTGQPRRYCRYQVESALASGGQAARQRFYRRSVYTLFCYVSGTSRQNLAFQCCPRRRQ